MQLRLALFHWLPRWRDTTRHQLGWTGMLPQVLAIVGLTIGLTYLFLAEDYIHYRTPTLHFNPNVQLGKASFAVLDSELTPRQRFPSFCGFGRKPDFLLIQTSATSFEGIVAYSRRLASPNDNDLSVLFVRNAVPGQAWKEFARGSFPRSHHRPLVPANCLAMLNIQQGGDPSPHYLSTRSRLIDLQEVRKKQAYVVLETRTNYFTDSLTEVCSRSTGTNRQFRTQETSRVARTIAPTDAAYYSYVRFVIRGWVQKEDSLLLR